MTELLEKRSVQLVLALIVILIWGNNMIKIVDLSTDKQGSGEGQELSVDSAIFSLEEQSEYEPERNFRDPFLPALTLPPLPANRPMPPEETKPVELPRLRLTGIIDETALIQGRDQVVYYAAPGDTLEGATVTAIRADSVMMIFQSKEFVVTF